MTVIVALAVAWWVDRARLNSTAKLWEARAESLHEIIELREGKKMIWGEESGGLLTLPEHVSDSSAPAP